MIYAIVGSGGKTTLVHRMAEQFRREGKKVFVTTSTHMLVEEDTLLTDDAGIIIEELERTGYVMAGNPGNRNRICSLSPETYRQVCERADEVLVEADGSNCLPVKFPNDTEPVIYENVEEILIVCAPHAIGKTIGETAFRKELVLQCLKVSEAEKLKASHIQKLVREGYLEKLGRQYPDKKLSICPACLDTPEQKKIGDLLKENVTIYD